MANDRSLKQYQYIIIDEAHERNVNTDVLIGFIKQLLTIRKDDIHIIITSATLDEELFKNYF